MPYYISDTQSDCAGWAALVAETPTSDPRVIGCHQTKQDAIDQMIAASISDGIEPAGDWATRQLPEMIEEGEVVVEAMPEQPPLMAALSEAYNAVKSILDEIVEKMQETEAPSEELIVDDVEVDMQEARSASPIEHRWVAVDKGTRSIAFTNLELRAMADGEDDWIVQGYAAVFDSPSEPLPFTEYVKRGAFKKTIKDGADVRLLIDHTGVPLARTKSGTLTLTEDDRGLFMKATLDPSNPDAVKIRSALKRGDLSQMSFAFETIKDSWNAERTVRELKEVRLHDVSIVTYPAYEQTSAEIRNNQITDTPVANVQTISLRKAQVLLAKTRAVK